MAVTLVTGAGGQLGRELTGEGFVGLDHATLDVTDADAVRAAFEAHRPIAVIHTAAWADPDGCQLNPDRAFAVHEVGTRNVATAAAAIGAYVVYISTDYVFDGDKPDPYVETDAPNPQSVYGASKLAGEATLGAASAVVRTSWLCGRHGHNIVETILGRSGPLAFVTDQRAHATHAADLAQKLRWFVAERPTGIWHVTNQGAMTAYALARTVLEIAGDDPDRVSPITTAELNRPAPRPANAVLENARLAREGTLLPDFRESLPALIRELAP